MTNPKLAANSVTRDKLGADMFVAVAFAMVNSNGTCGLARNVVACTRVGTGQFELTLGESYSTTTHIAVVTPHGAGASNAYTATTSDSGGRLQVFIRDGTNYSSRSFHVVVFRP